MTKKRNDVVKCLIMIALAASFASCSAKLDGITIPGSGPDDVKAKDAAHANFVQCGDSQLEVLVDMTKSDFENTTISNSPVSVRDLTRADTAYTTTQTNEIPETIQGTEGGVATHTFVLGTQAGMSIAVTTKDFKTGDALYQETANSTSHVMSCTFYTSKPAELPIPAAAAAPGAGAAPAPAPNADGGIPATGPANAKYLQCKGSQFELYVDFSQADLASWSNIGGGKFGIRPIAQPTAAFKFYGDSSASSYSMNGTDYVSFNGDNATGDQIVANVTTTDMVTASASIQSTSAGTETDDSTTCQWLQNHVYASKYGW